LSDSSADAIAAHASAPTGKLFGIRSAHRGGHRVLKGLFLAVGIFLGGVTARYE